MELEKLFDNEHKKAEDKTTAYEKELINRWNEHMKGANLIMEKLAFLPPRFKLKLKFHDFSIENCKQSYYPAVMLFVGGNLTNISKYGNEGEGIGVSGFGLFPLMGEAHTFESFIKKIAKY